MDHRPVRNDCNLSTVAKNLPFSYFQQLRFLVKGRADALSSRITHRSRPFMLDHGEHHVAHLAFVLRRHHYNVWHSTKVSDVEQAMVSLSVAACDSTTIQTELHVQVLNTNVVDQLIKTSLQECRID